NDNVCVQRRLVWVIFFGECHFVEYFKSHFAQAFSIQLDRRQRGIDETCHIDILTADHRNLTGNADAHFSQRGHGTDRREVVNANERGGWSSSGGKLPDGCAAALERLVAFDYLLNLEIFLVKNPDNRLTISPGGSTFIGTSDEGNSIVAELGEMVGRFPNSAGIVAGNASDELE